MSRGPGTITTAQALASALVGVALVAAVVAGLARLLEAGAQETPLPAAAAPAAPPRCPTPDRPATTAPPQITAGELIECPRSYDGRVVRYEGEAVRAVLLRGERAWVQLNDDPYALTLGPLPEHRTAVGGNSGLAVSIPAEAAARIAHVGDHRTHGDRLAVTGVFHRADPLDAGGPTIQAIAVRITRPGGPTTGEVHTARVLTAVALTGAAGIAALLAHRRRVRP